MNKNKLLKILTSSVIGGTLATVSVLPFVLTTNDNNAVTTLDSATNTNEEKTVTEGDAYAFTEWTVSETGGFYEMTSEAEVSGVRQTLILNIEIYNGNEITITGIFGGATSITYDFSLAFDSMKDSAEKDYIIKSIGSRAFDGCSNLTSITIPNSVTSIENFAFLNCSGLTGELVIPPSVMAIGDQVFYGCYFSSINLSGNTKYKFATNVDESCQVVVPISNEGIAELDDTCNNVVGSLAVGDLIIPDNVKYINASAFAGCTGLLSVFIPNSVEQISDGAFLGCSQLTGELVIPDSVIEIGVRAFQECTGLDSVVVGNKVESIEGNAFIACSSLNSVVVGGSVKNIGDSAFANCGNLETISWWLNDTINSADYIVGNNAFGGNTDMKIYTNDLNKFSEITTTYTPTELEAEVTSKTEEITVGKKADIATISLNNGQKNGLTYDLDVTEVEVNNQTIKASEAKIFNITSDGVLQYDGSEILGAGGLEIEGDVSITVQVHCGDASTPVETDVMTFKYNKNALNVGAVVGGTIGGIVGLGAIGGTTYYFTNIKGKKRKPTKAKK